MLYPLDYAGVAALQILGTTVCGCVHIFCPAPFAVFRCAAIQVRPVCLHEVRILLTSNENANHSQLQDFREFACTRRLIFD
jgi:hypothetical protein